MKNPPRLPDRFLRWFCSREVLETLQGDLYELYQKRLDKKGKLVADLYFTFDVISACRPFAFSKRRRGYFNSNNNTMIGHYLKVSGRNLMRYKTYSLMNIGGLSLALACCMLFILYVKDELTFDRFHEKQSRIYRVTSQILHDDEAWEDWYSGNTGMIQGPEFKNSIPGIENYMRMKDVTFIVREGTDLIREPSIYVDNSFLSVFSFRLLKGNPKTALNEANSVVMTPDKAMKFFGTTDVIGKSIELGVDGAFENFVVTGVIEASPGNSSIQLGLVVPLAHYIRDHGNDEAWINFYLNTFLILHPQADPKAVESKFADVFEQNAAGQVEDAKKNWGFSGRVIFGMQPLSEVHLHPEMTVEGGLSGAREPLYIYILAAIAAFILLIACINFINLAIAQSLKRSKEVGIRKVVGSMRGQLIRQFLGESFMICLISFSLAVFLAWLCIPGFNQLSDKNMSLSYLVDVRLVSGFIVLFVVTTIAAGFYPALIYSGFQPVHVLYGEQKLSSKNYFAKALIVVQFSLSAILIISTVAVYSQFDFMTKKDLGFNPNDLIRIDLQWWRKENPQIMEQFRSRLLGQSSIINIGAKNGGRTGTMMLVGDEKKVGTDVGRVDNEYFSTMQIPIIAGRNFSPEFPSDTIDAAIVNEAFIKAAGWTDPIGKTIDNFGWKKKYIVVGVVKDFHFRSLKEEIGPHVFVQSNGINLGQFWVRINPVNIPETLTMLKSLYRELVPTYPFEYEFADAMVAKQYEQDAKWKQVIQYAAIISIFISCMGLFGLTTLVIGQRTREIAIRKVLGAPVPTIISHLSGGFIRLTLLAFLIAIPVGHYAIQQWLGRFAYRVEIGWWMYLMVGIASLSIAFATISFQSIKAARANPVNSLKH